MPHCKVECMYCGHKYETYIYSGFEGDNLRCVQCKDKHLKIRKTDDNKGDVFGYNKKNKDEE